MAIGAGCRSDPIFREMSDSTYIRTMIELRTLPIGTIDSVTRARRADSILRAFGVTAEELEAIAVRLSEDPTRAAAIFRAIENPPRSSPP
jgi:hypothetical protein